MNRQYEPSPADPGEFLPSWKAQEIDADHETSDGVTTFDGHPFAPLKFFVQVGGGWRGFKSKHEVTRCHKYAP